MVLQEIVFLGKKKGLMFLGKRRTSCYFYVNLLPPLEILAQARNVGLSSKKVINDYNNLTVLLRAEREIMLRRKPEEIVRAGRVKLKEAVLRVRKGKF
jgi:PHP family Zn ribbon phosphoesterase